MSKDSDNYDEMSKSLDEDEDEWETIVIDKWNFKLFILYQFPKHMVRRVSKRLLKHSCPLFADNRAGFPVFIVCFPDEEETIDTVLAENRFTAKTRNYRFDNWGLVGHFYFPRVRKRMGENEMKVKLLERLTQMKKDYEMKTTLDGAIYIISEKYEMYKTEIAQKNFLLSLCSHTKYY